MLRRRRVPTDQVPDVELRRSVVGEVGGVDPVPLQIGEQLRSVSRRSATSMPTKGGRRAGPRTGSRAGDRALADEPTERAEAAGRSASSPRGSPLALSPELGRSATKRSRSKFTLAPQAIATNARPFARCRSTHALTRDRKRAGGLEDRPRVLEHVFQRGARRVGVDEHHLVDQGACEPERLDRRPVHRHRRRRARRPASPGVRPRASASSRPSRQAARR